MEIKYKPKMNYREAVEILERVVSGYNNHVGKIDAKKVWEAYNKVRNG